MPGPTDDRRGRHAPRAPGARGFRVSWGAGARLARLGGLALLGVVAAPAARTAAQTRPRVEASVRPERVRVGDRFLVIVRVEDTRPPDDVLLPDSLVAELLGSTDRRATRVAPGGAIHVFERELAFRAGTPGPVSPAALFVVWGEDTVAVDVPRVEAVGSAVAWGAPSRPRVRTTDETLRDEGRPPTGAGRDADRERAPWGTVPPGSSAWGYGSWGLPDGAAPPALPPYAAAPGAWSPYGAVTSPWSPYAADPGAWSPAGPGAGVDGGLPTTGAWGWGPVGWRSPFRVTGWGIAPIGRGWAATAAGDPWWPELLPELDVYTTSVEGVEVPALLEAGVTPERVWVGQQVTLFATATLPPEAKALLGRTPRVELPAGPDGGGIDLPWAPATPVARRGRAEEARTWMRAWFPARAGAFVLDPVRLRVGRSGGSGAGDLEADPLVVEVSAIPVRDAPDGWRGAVGRWRVSARVEPETVAWGEPAMLVVEVAGAGDVRSLPRPDPGPVWGAELRSYGERVAVEARDGVLGGVRTFSWLLAPAEEGVVRIDPIVLAFFDPWIGGFGQVATEELSLSVDPLLADRARDARATSPPSGSRRTPAGGGGTTQGPLGAGPSLPADPAPAPAPGATSSSAPASGGGDPAAPRYAAAATRADVRRLEQSVARHPDDAGAWRALADAYGRSSPGEGWRAWALVSGLRVAPRDATLRRALWGSERWMPSRDTGLPRFPVTAPEALAALVVLAAAAVALGGTAWRARSRAGARTLLTVAAVAAGVGAVVAAGSLVRLSDDGRWGVVVEGPVDVRVAASGAAGTVDRLEPGTPVRVLERHGPWVRVRAEGVEGWVDGVQLLPLGGRG